MHASNLSPGKVEAGETDVQCYSWLHDEFKARPGCIRPLLKNRTKQQLLCISQSLNRIYLFLKCVLGISVVTLLCLIPGSPPNLTLKPQ